MVTKVNGLTLDLIHPESGATMRVHREKVVLTDPDIAWEEVAPRPRRQRQQVKQVRVPKRRDYVRSNRDSSVESRASSNQSAVSSRGQRLPRQRPQPSTSREPATFVRPTSLPPFSQHRAPKRQLEEAEEDYIAKRTRSRSITKRPAELTVGEPEAKKWRREQVDLLQFVSSYFCRDLSAM